MDCVMNKEINDELTDYYDWVRDNIKMIRWVLLDIAFGFDDYHLELIEERLQNILESNNSHSYASVEYPETAIRYLEIMFGKIVRESEMMDIEKIKGVREILYNLSATEFIDLLFSTKDEDERYFYIMIMMFVLLDKQEKGNRRRWMLIENIYGMLK